MLWEVCQGRTGGWSPVLRQRRAKEAACIPRALNAGALSLNRRKKSIKSFALSSPLHNRMSYYLGRHGGVGNDDLNLSERAGHVYEGKLLSTADVAERPQVSFY